MIERPRTISSDVHFIPDEFKVEKLAATGILLVVFDYARADISE